MLLVIAIWKLDNDIFSMYRNLTSPRFDHLDPSPYSWTEDDLVDLHSFFREEFSRERTEIESYPIELLVVQGNKIIRHFKRGQTVKLPLKKWEVEVVVEVEAETSEDAFRKVYDWMSNQKTKEFSQIDPNHWEVYEPTEIED